ncbi:MAG: type II toxin-antitoxin system RelE/ParE family toxin [Gammaproteobacteria bacterium]|jgi:toxin ParE1/3/4
MLTVRREAEGDIKKAFDWYEEQRSGLGEEFLVQIEAVFGRIEDDPELYESVFKRVRRALIRRFPYSVYFLLESGNPVVIAVLHQRRSPVRWRERTPGKP